MNAMTILLLTALLLLGSFGWGSVFRILLCRSSGSKQIIIGNYQIIPIGFSLLTIFGGFLVALNWAFPFVLFVVLIIGTFIAVFLYRKSIISVLFWKDASSHLFLVATILLSSILALGIVIGRSFQRLDDFPAYVYLAKKIVLTGGLIDPFNNRRVLSSGASTLYQSLFLRYTGTQSIFAFDNLFALLAIALLLFQFARHSGVSKLFTAFLCVALVAGTGTHIEFNLSPRFAITYLTIAVFMFMYDNRKISPATWSMTYPAVLAVISAAIFSLRPMNALLPLSVCALVLVVVKGQRVKSLLAYAVVFIISIAGWALALLQSSGTFFYPLMSGTTSRSYSSDTLHWGAVQYFKSIWWTISYNNEFLILVLIMILCSATWFVKSFERFPQKLLTFIVIGLIFETIGFSLFLKGHDPWMISRYLGPSFLAVGVIAVIALAQIDIGSRSMPSQSIRSITSAFVRSPFNFLSSKIYVLLALVMIFVVCMGFQPIPTNSSQKPETRPLFSTEFKGTYENFKTDLSSGFRALTSSSPISDPLSGLVPTFSEINKAIPRDSYVLSAVETPSLLDMNKFKVSTLDWPSQNSSAPGLNLNSSVESFISYLRSIGVQYLLVQSQDDPASMYNLDAAKRLTHTPWFSYRAMGSSIIKWDTLESDLLRDTGLKISTFGGYSLIAIPNA